VSQHRDSLRKKERSERLKAQVQLDEIRKKKKTGAFGAEDREQGDRPGKHVIEERTVGGEKTEKKGTTTEVLRGGN